MAFVNKFATEEDIKKYGLDEHKAKHDWFAWREGRPEGYQHYWTVDRQNDTFLMFAKTMMDTGQSGRLEPSREAIFVLGIGQQTFKILLYSHESSSSYNTDSPYRIVWKLVDIEGDFVALTKLEVLAILRSALIAHKRGNPWIQTPNVVVECLF